MGDSGFAAAARPPRPGGRAGWQRPRPREACRDVTKNGSVKVARVAGRKRMSQVWLLTRQAQWCYHHYIPALHPLAGLVVQWHLDRMSKDFWGFYNQIAVAPVNPSLADEAEMVKRDADSESGQLHVDLMELYDVMQDFAGGVPVPHFIVAPTRSRLRATGGADSMILLVRYWLIASGATTDSQPTDIYVVWIHAKGL